MQKRQLIKLSFSFCPVLIYNSAKLQADSKEIFKLKNFTSKQINIKQPMLNLNQN